MECLKHLFCLQILLVEDALLPRILWIYHYGKGGKGQICCFPDVIPDRDSFQEFGTALKTSGAMVAVILKLSWPRPG